MINKSEYRLSKNVSFPFFLVNIMCTIKFSKLFMVNWQFITRYISIAVSTTYYRTEHNESLSTNCLNHYYNKWNEMKQITEKINGSIIFKISATIFLPTSKATERLLHMYKQRIRVSSHVLYKTKLYRARRLCNIKNMTGLRAAVTYIRLSENIPASPRKVWQWAYLKPLY